MLSGECMVRHGGARNDVLTVSEGMRGEGEVRTNERNRMGIVSFPFTRSHTSLVAMTITGAGIYYTILFAAMITLVLSTRGVMEGKVAVCKGK